MLTCRHFIRKHSSMTKMNVEPGDHYEALMLLLRTSEQAWNASRVFFDRWDLSPSQFNVLNLLHGMPEGLNQSELSRQLIMHRSNATGLIDRLEARKLLQRQPIPGDRRAHRVVLTKAGEKLIDSILPEYYVIAEAIWAEIPVARTQQLMGDLTLLSATIAKLEDELKK